MSLYLKNKKYFHLNIIKNKNFIILLAVKMHKNWNFALLRQLTTQNLELQGSHFIGVDNHRGKILTIDKICKNKLNFKSKKSVISYKF